MVLKSTVTKSSLFEEKRKKADYCVPGTTFCDNLEPFFGVLKKEPHET